MGSFPSKQNNSSSSSSSTPVPSPSVAYGRIRIHDSQRLTNNGLTKMRQQARRGDQVVATTTTMRRSRSASDASANQVHTTTEGTRLLPLVASPTKQQYESVLDLQEEDEQGSPDFVAWITPALLCAMAYAFYNIFIKLGSYSIHPILGGVILQLVAALLGLGLLLLLRQQDRNDELEYDSQGIQWSICAGIAVSIAELLSFFVSGMGVPAVQSIPVIIGGSVVFGTILGLVLLKESLTARGWFGVVLLVGGICLVGTDSGFVKE